MFRISRMHSLVVIAGLAAAAAACSSDSTEPTNDPPTGLAVAVTGEVSVHVTWDAVTGATELILQRAEGASGSFAEIARPAASATSYDDTGLNPQTTYRYRLGAVRSAGDSPFSTEASVTTTGVTEVAITTDITTNTTWTADHVYRLVGFRKVASGATLNIEAGTKIIGDYNTLGSSLFILRGAKLVAVGDAEHPIVFTSQQAVGTRQSGDWGGVIFVGNGIDNRSGTVNVEGTGTSNDNPLIQYNGGNNNADNSGILKYVRIEFGGFATVQDAEFNSFTFAAIGSGTTVDYVESLAGLDDCFEWWGGAMDAKHLLCYDSGDDGFDMAEGYVGRLQYGVVYDSRLIIPRPNAGFTSQDPEGIENDGCNGSGCDLAFNSTPFTIPIIANFTVVGPGTGVFPTGGAYGAVLRRGTGGHYINGIFARWASAAIGYRDADSKARETAGLLSIKNVLIVESPVAFQAGQQTYDAAGNAVIFDATSTAASIFTKFPTGAPNSVADFDWSLSASSPARTGGLTTFTGDLLGRAGSFITPTTYRGAADPNGPKWWEGWSYYARN